MPATHDLALDDTVLRYSITQPTEPDSDATPLLLLHPWFGCRQFWDPVASRFGATAYAPDWYSLGARGDWSPWASPAGLATAALALMDEHHLDQVDLVGNSVGGIVAQVIAARHPSRVRRLVLVGTGASLGGRPTEFGRLVSTWIDGTGDRESLAPQFVDALVAQPLPASDRDSYIRAVLEADPSFVSAVLIAARGLDLRPELSAITAPTLVIRGEHDTARTPAHVAELLAGIPHSRAVEMSGCGHSPMIELPDHFADLVLAHLRD